jgi:hypothetical protein
MGGLYGHAKKVTSQPGTGGSRRGGSGGGSSGGSSGGGSTTTPTKTSTKTYYYNPQTKTYSTQKIAGVKGVSRSVATSASKAARSGSGSTVGLTKQQIARSSSLTESAQIKEFGRVVQPQKQSGINISAASGVSVSPTKQSQSNDYALNQGKDYYAGKDIKSYGTGSKSFNAQSNIVQPIQKKSESNLSKPFIDIRNTRFGKALSGASAAIISEEKAGKDTGIAGRSIVASQKFSEISNKEVATAAVLTGSAAYAGPVALIKGVVTATAVSEGTKAAVKFGQKKETKEYYKQPYFKDVLSSAYQYEASKIATETSTLPVVGGAINKLASAAYWINPSLSFKKTEFEKALAIGFSEQGLKGEELQKAVEAGRIARAGASLGEGAGLLSISTYSEIVGSKNVAALSGTTTKKTFGGVFKKTFSPIAKAGVIEGIGQEVVQLKSREQTIDPSKVAIAGVAGGVSAGVVGGSIVARQATKGKGKVLLTAAYTSDPFELPGDLLAGQIEKKAKKTITPIFSVTPTNVMISSKTSTRSPNKVEAKANSIIDSITKTKTKSSTKTKSAVKVPTFTQTPTKTTIFSPVSSTNIPTFSSVFTPTSVPTNVPTNIPVTIPTQVPLPVQIPTQVPVTITTPTADFLPLIIPPVLPGGGGGSSIFNIPKRGSRGSQYMPSLVGLQKGKKRKKKGFLSGLEIRGI